MRYLCIKKKYDEYEMKHSEFIVNLFSIFSNFKLLVTIF